MRKSMKSAAAAFAVSLLVTGPAFAQQDDKAEKTEAAEKSKKDGASEEAKGKEQKVTCKRIALDMSTRRKQKVCLTEKGWEDYKKEKRGGN